MEFNIDCARDILLYAEQKGLDERIRGNAIYKALSQYAEDQITYCSIKLYEGGYLDLSYGSAIGGNTHIQWIKDITFNGHQFLDKIRDPKIYSKTMSIAKKVGSATIEAISKIASGVIAEIIKTQMGP